MANLLENHTTGAEKKIVEGGGGGRIDNLDSSRNVTLNDVQNALRASQDSGIVVNMFGNVDINMNEDNICDKPGGGKPVAGFGIKPESGSGVKPESGSGVKPEHNGGKPESGSGIKPALTPAQILDTPPLARGGK